MENTDSTKKIYLVGGAVRDSLLNLPIKDKDYVAVGFTPQDFSHLKQVGKNFPVFLLNSHTQIALARTETKISKGYNGFTYQTQNVTLAQDLKRRDLTINAMAFDEQSKALIDPFGGQQDLKDKILRHTSQAFCEDPLRVLRIARFRAKLGIEWKIHPSTKDLIHTMKQELKFLEPNRIYQEVKTALSYKDSYLFFETLFELGILKEIFPFIYTLTQHKKDKTTLFAYTMQTLKALEDSPLLLKLTILYQSITSPQEIDIQIPNTLKKPMLTLIQNHKKTSSLLNPYEILAFLESFKRDKNLLKAQITLLKTQNITIPLKSEVLLNLFDKISHYSPQKWIHSQKTKISGEQIKQYVLEKKLGIIQEVLDKLRINPS